MNADNYNNELNDKRHCNKCKPDPIEGQKFCEFCEEMLLDEPIKAQDVEYKQYYILGSEQYISDMAMFIRKKTCYYMNEFNKLKTEHRIMSWNWGGMLWGAYWFAYRKMYYYAAVYIVIELLDNLLIDYTYGVLSYILTIASGIFGNYLYMTHIERAIEKYETNERSKREEYIKKYGGTSKIGVIFVIIVAILVHIK